MLNYKVALVWIKLTPTKMIYEKFFKAESTVKLIHMILEQAIAKTNNVTRIKNIHITSNL